MVFLISRIGGQRSEVRKSKVEDSEVGRSISDFGIRRAVAGGMQSEFLRSASGGQSQTVGVGISEFMGRRAEVGESDSRSQILTSGVGGKKLEVGAREVGVFALKVLRAEGRKS